MTKILVVDDHIDGLLSLCALLQTLGYDVASTHDAMQAMALAARFCPDLIFLDIGMPGLSGYDLAQVLRADSRFAELPIVAVTGYGRREDKERAREAGFTAHLTKPADVEDILATIRRLMPPR
jgi:CheY-like chemotaxis protein